jgi:hypothetical protein
MQHGVLDLILEWKEGRVSKKMVKSKESLGLVNIHVLWYFNMLKMGETG